MDKQELNRQFRKIISNDSDEWYEFSPKEIMDFMGFCISINNYAWVRKIHQLAQKRLKDKGKVFNGVLGWVYPEEIKEAGVSQNSIIDLDKFHRYMEYKAAAREAEYKQEYKEKMEREHDEYLNQVMKEAEECSPSPSENNGKKNIEEKPDGSTATQSSEK